MGATATYYPFTEPNRCWVQNNAIFCRVHLLKWLGVLTPDIPAMSGLVHARQRKDD